MYVRTEDTMLKLADKLTAEKVDSVLVRLLPDEKSAKRRMNKLESFIFTKSQDGRAWLENYLLANDTEATEEELDKAEKQSLAITMAILFEFEAYLKDEKYWHESGCNKTPESIEARIMENQPSRWLARFPQNRNSKRSKKSSGVIYDTVLKRLKEQGKSITAKNLFYETSMIVDWHPELEDEDRVSECKWNDKEQDWELVVVKPDGQIIGNPTKTLDDIIKEGIVARSRTVGTSGRKLKLDDAFLGLLVA